MNTEPPTGDDLQRMLVAMKQNVLEGAIAAPRKKARRNWALGIGIVAFLGLGAASGGVALGLVPSPFTASAPAPAVSTAAPAPSPTATTPPPAPTEAPPVVTNDGPTPKPTLPLTCAQIADRAGLDSVIPVYRTSGANIYSASRAAYADAGVRSCIWSDDPSTGTFLIADFSDDTATGSEWVASRRSAGDTALAIGTAGAMSCVPHTQECSVSLVAGDFWVDFTFSGDQDIPAHATAVARGLAAALEGVTPIARWTGPDTTWSTVTTCDALPASPNLGSVVGTPALTGPTPVKPGTATGIDRTFGGLTCLWQVPDDQTVTDQEMRRIDVTVAPGGAWGLAASAENSDRTAIDIPGADQAYLSCVQGDGKSCWVDVVVDSTWIEIGYGNGYGEVWAPKLEAAAAAVIAGHPGR